MCSGDCRRQCISRVIRSRYVAHAENDFNELGHLLLVGSAVPHHGLLDLLRRKFHGDHRQAGERQKYHAPSLCNGNSAGDIFREVKTFHAGHSGPVLVHQRRYRIEDS